MNKTFYLFVIKVQKKREEINKIRSVHLIANFNNCFINSTHSLFLL